MFTKAFMDLIFECVNEKSRGRKAWSDSVQGDEENIQLLRILS